MKTNNKKVNQIDHSFGRLMAAGDGFGKIISKQNAPIQPKVFGNSLSSEYALERALLESSQPIHLRDHYKFL